MPTVDTGHEDDANARVEQGLLAQAERLNASLRDTEAVLHDLLGTEAVNKAEPRQEPHGEIAELTNQLDLAFERATRVFNLVDEVSKAF